MTLNDTMQTIRFFDTFSNVTPVNKGWSADKKYCVTKADGMKYMLRISLADRYEKRKALFEILERVSRIEVYELSKPYSIIILGANGSGKSTLGRELARVLYFTHFDVEEYYFYQTDIP